MTQSGHRELSALALTNPGSELEALLDGAFENFLHFPVASCPDRNRMIVSGRIMFDNLCVDVTQIG